MEMGRPFEIKPQMSDKFHTRRDSLEAQLKDKLSYILTAYDKNDLNLYTNEREKLRLESLIQQMMSVILIPDEEAFKTAAKTYISKFIDLERNSGDIKSQKYTEILYLKQQERNINLLSLEADVMKQIKIKQFAEDAYKAASQRLDEAEIDLARGKRNKERLKAEYEQLTEDMQKPREPIQSYLYGGEGN